MKTYYSVITICNYSRNDIYMVVLEIGRVPTNILLRTQYISIRYNMILRSL